jgi:hypothetical protein
MLTKKMKGINGSDVMGWVWEKSLLYAREEQYPCN